MIDISQNPRVSQLLGRIEEVRRAVAKLERTNAERREFEREVESWYLEIGRYVHWLLRQEPEALARVEAEAKLWAAEIDARLSQRKGALRQRAAGGADDEEGWSVDLAAGDAPSVDDGSVVELATDSAEQGIDRRDLGEGTRSVSVSLILGDELPELEAEPLDEAPLAELEDGALEPLGEEDAEAVPTHPTADPRPPARPVGPSMAPRPSPVADPVPLAARVRAPEAPAVGPAAAIAGRPPTPPVVSAAPPAAPSLAQRVPPAGGAPPVRAAAAPKPPAHAAAPPTKPAAANLFGAPASGAPSQVSAAARAPTTPPVSPPVAAPAAPPVSPPTGSPRSASAVPTARRGPPQGEEPHPIEPLDLKPTLSDIDIEALTDSVVPAATTPVDHAWLGALRDLTEVVGAPEKGTLAEADCLAAANRLLNATTNMNVRWMGFPDGVQQALVGCIASRARNLQLRMAVDVEVRLTLGRLRRFHKARKLPELVALDDDGRPEGKSWEHDAHRWWAQLKAGG